MSDQQSTSPDVYRQEQDARFGLIKAEKDAILQQYIDCINRGQKPAMVLPETEDRQHMHNDVTNKYASAYDLLGAQLAQLTCEGTLYLVGLAFGRAEELTALIDTLRTCIVVKGFKTEAGEEAHRNYSNRPQGLATASFHERAWELNLAQMAALRAVLCDGRALFEKNSTTKDCAAW
jgi:hypothetical protein